MNTRLKFKAKERAVVIVAHPDDETIWMGGFILKHPELDWTIMALCRASDADRAPKFKRVCERLGATAIIEDMDDEGNLDYEQTVAEAERIVTKYFFNLPIDYLFTHGANGEYGHESHIATNEAVKHLLSGGQIKAKRAFCFSYVKKSQKLYAELRPAAAADLTLALSKREFEDKKSIMTSIYGFHPDGIDTNYCTNPEAFKELK
ncbi:PIG-L family deacetylase [Candidatus Falkowbacteria bacterium]|nr:PIG-L family deacetylase [Candidatus Falkowbacteria bacterium]